MSTFTRRPNKSASPPNPRRSGRPTSTSRRHQQTHTSVKQARHSNALPVGNFVDHKRQEFEVADLISIKEEYNASNRPVSGSVYLGSIEGGSRVRARSTPSVDNRSHVSTVGEEVSPDGRVKKPSTIRAEPDQTPTPTERGFKSLLRRGGFSEKASKRRKLIQTDSSVRTANKRLDARRPGFRQRTPSDKNSIDTVLQGHEFPQRKPGERITNIGRGIRKSGFRGRKSSDETRDAHAATLLALARIRGRRPQELAYTDGEDPGEYERSTLRDLIGFEKELVSNNPIALPLDILFRETTYEKFVVWRKDGPQGSSVSNGGSVQQSIDDDEPGYGKTNIDKLVPGVKDVYAIEDPTCHTIFPSTGASSAGSVNSDEGSQSLNSTAPTDHGAGPSGSLTPTGFETEDNRPSSPHKSLPASLDNQGADSRYPEDGFETLQCNPSAWISAGTMEPDDDLPAPATNINLLEEDYDAMNDMKIEDSESATLFRKKAESFKRMIKEIPSDYKFKASTRDPGHLQSHLEANSENWRKIRDTLGPLYRFAVFENGVWTIDTTIMSSNKIKDLPIRIAQRPVILSYTTPVIGSFPDHPDPAENRPIDPKKCLDDETLRLLFRTYPGAKAACVYLNNTLIILHDGNLNRRTELRRRPRKFGGLDVDYLMAEQKYTGGPAANGSISDVNRAEKLSPRPPPVTDVGSKFCIKYTQPPDIGVDRKSTRSDVSAGLRLRRNSSDFDCITMPLHSLLNGADVLYMDQPEGAAGDGPWSNPGRFSDENKDNFEFSFREREFGKLYRHFEPSSNISHEDGDQRMLQHDIALVEALPEKADDMPFLVFRDENRAPIKMEWASDNEDFVSQEVFLLGFEYPSRRPEPKPGPGSKTATVSESGTVVFSHKSFENKRLDIGPNETIRLVTDEKPLQRTESGVCFSQLSDPSLSSTPTVSSESYGCGAPSTYDDPMDLGIFSENNRSSQDTITSTSRSTREHPVTVEGRMYQNLTDPERNLKYFQRSYLWRAHFRETGKDGQLSNKLPIIEGASGCPLAMKVPGDKGKVYRILGFQNSAINGQRAREDPGLPEQHRMEGAVFGTFRTYQCICLPEALRKNWAIVWNPVNKNQRSKTKDARCSQWRSIADRISKKRRYAPRLLKLQQREYNRALFILQSSRPRKLKLGFRQGRSNAKTP